jgi:hypothetical protein
MLRQGLLLARAPHALRWRLETFGLYMPSLPESRPWWRVNVAALGALLGQLPGYMRWLYQMQALRRGGARELWRLQAHGDAVAWEAWLAVSEDEANSSQPSAVSSSLASATKVSVYRCRNHEAESFQLQRFRDGLGLHE